MPQQTSPFLEGKYGWNYGESLWNTGADENWLKYSYMLDNNVESVTASLPVLVNGQAHFLTTDNRFYFAVAGVWYSSPCPKWFTFKVRSTGDCYQFNGTSVVQVDSPLQLDSRLDSAETTISSLGTAAFEDLDDLATQAELDVASAQANDYSDTVMTTHEAALDPHPQYMTEAESDAKYLQIANTQIFGQRTITTNVAAIAKTAAVDTTLVSNADYTQVTGIFTTLPDGIVNGVTQDTNSMVIETTGPYEIKVWASMTSSVNNTNVAYKFAINGVIGTARRPRARIGTTGDRVSVAAHGYINLTAGDVVTLWFASDQTANITIEDAVFSVVYLGGFSA
ncbi:hypothetical protein D3C85_567750 [compost metagenome]